LLNPVWDMYPPEPQAETEVGPELATLIDQPETSMAGAATLAAVVVGMFAAALYRHGAFYPLDAFGVVIVSLVLTSMAFWRQRDREGMLVGLTTVGLAAWWLSRAISQQSVVAFLPLGASMLGFLAAYLVVRRLKGDDPSRVVLAIVAIGALSAAAGIAGVLWRFRPLAQASGRYWEVATTLTYPAAAAVVFIIALLVAMSLDLHRRTIRVAICLCLAGLIGTQSHWDLLALACGALAVPPRRWLTAVWPLTTGAAAGVAVVASAAGRTSGWFAGAVVLTAVALSTITGRRSFPRAGTYVAVAVVAAVAAGTAVLMVVAPFGHGPHQSTNQNQTLAWSASSRAWRTSVLTGVGPPKVTTSNEAVDAYPGFAPDSYLTVNAEGGLAGTLLLLGVGATVAFGFRRRSLVSSCAIGASVAFAAAGAIDFDWQLPALALLGGCVAGLASGLTGHGDQDPSPAPPQTQRTHARASAVWLVGAALVVTTQLIVGFSQTAGGLSRAQSAEPPPSATPQAPGRDILKGPDATDPYMLHIDRRYYLYLSEGTTFMNVPLRVGNKLGHWGKPIDALPHLPAWAEPGLTWAPDVHKVAGGWALYYSALLRGVNPYTHCIGSAFAASARGPFVASPHPLICQLAHRGSIDARIFVQSKGHLDLLWKSEDNANPSVPGPDQNGYTGIYAQRLSASGRALLGKPTKIFAPSEPWEGTIVEAPDMVKAWGEYWLFFSGNWYDSASYGIGVAECQSPFGPCSDPDPKPFLGSNLQGVGPGESSVFRDGNGVYLLYNPFKANDPGPIIPRPVAITRIGFTPQGPYLASA
jgi:hypothetical protein